MVTNTKSADMAKKTGWNGLGLFNYGAGLWGNNVVWSLHFVWGTPTDVISVKRPDGYYTLLDKLLATSDLKSKDELAQQTVKMLYDDVTMICFYVTGPTFVERPGINGIDHHESGIKFWWDPGKVWLDKSVR
jgi:hypothetical protein